MSERHTVDFARCSFNIVTDADRRTITLQFDHEAPRLGSRPISLILKAIRRRYGDGPIARLSRWKTGEANPFVLPSHSRSHPDHPDVLCYEMGVKGGGGGTMDSALAALLDFLRRQPGYERTYGAPLDLDGLPTRVRRGAEGDASTSAYRALKGLMERRQRPRRVSR